VQSLANPAALAYSHPRRRCPAERKGVVAKKDVGEELARPPARSYILCGVWRSDRFQA
jgi:hypothetical protein